MLISDTAADKPRATPGGMLSLGALLTAKGQAIATGLVHTLCGPRPTPPVVQRQIYQCSLSLHQQDNGYQAHDCGLEHSHMSPLVMLVFFGCAFVFVTHQPLLFICRSLVIMAARLSFSLSLSLEVQYAQLVLFCFCPASFVLSQMPRFSIFISPTHLDQASISILRPILLRCMPCLCPIQLFCLM